MSLAHQRQIERDFLTQQLLREGLLLPRLGIQHPPPTVQSLKISQLQQVLRIKTHVLADS
jgi:hypothetical protein